MQPKDPIATVAAHLGHEFAAPDLLRDALTHRSYVHERPDLAPRDNERLELLGDSVVGLAAAKLLFDRYPSAREGELTRRRADLVCERSLAAIAEMLEMGPALRLGRGEERSGGRTKSRLLSCALEACLGAIAVDAGLPRALVVAETLLGPHVETLAPGQRDFKSRLQEQVQAKGGTSPRYEITRMDGPEHERVFTVVVRYGDEEARGTGRSKLEAEQVAARTALEQLEQPRSVAPPSDEGGM